MYYVSCIIYICRQRDGKQPCFRKGKNRQMAGYPYYWYDSRENYRKHACFPIQDMVCSCN